MSKELEALLKIRTHLGKNLGIWNCEEYAILVQALTPPTADEVCKALSEYLGHTIITRKNKHGITFNYYEAKQTIIRLNHDLLNIKLLLPIHLTTMIGRFYEGLEK